MIINNVVICRPAFLAIHHPIINIVLCMVGVKIKGTASSVYHINH